VDEGARARRDTLNDYGRSRERWAQKKEVKAESRGGRSRESRTRSKLQEDQEWKVVELDVSKTIEDEIKGMREELQVEGRQHTEQARTPLEPLDNMYSLNLRIPQGPLSCFHCSS
jgi:hypothetical protein